MGTFCASQLRLSGTTRSHVRFDGIRQFARGGRRAPHKPLLPLYTLARLKYDRQAGLRMAATRPAGAIQASCQARSVVEPLNG